MSAITSITAKCALIYGLYWMMPRFQDQELALPVLLMVLLAAMLVWNASKALLSSNQSAHSNVTPSNANGRPMTTSDNIDKAGKPKKTPRPTIKVLVVSPGIERLERRISYHRNLQHGYRAQAISLRKGLCKEREERAAEQAAHRQEVARLKHRLQKANTAYFKLFEVEKRAESLQMKYDEKVAEVESLTCKGRQDLNVLWGMYNEQIAEVQLLNDRAQEKKRRDSIKALQQQTSHAVKVRLLKHDIERAQYKVDAADHSSKVWRSENVKHRDLYRAERAAKEELLRNKERDAAKIEELTWAFEALVEEYLKVEKDGINVLRVAERREQRLRDQAGKIARLKEELAKAKANSGARPPACVQFRVTTPPPRNFLWASPASERQ